MSLYASMQGAADVLGRDEQGKEVVAIVEGLLKSCRSPPKLQELSQAPHPVIVPGGLGWSWEINPDGWLAQPIGGEDAVPAQPARGAAAFSEVL